MPASSLPTASSKTAISSSTMESSSKSVKAARRNAAMDFGGDLLLPGLIELHTDHLEAHVTPRPKVHWDTLAAVLSYDAQIATSGITTVLDSLRVWRDEGAGEVGGQAAALSSVDRQRPQGRPVAHRAFPASALRSADADSGRGRRRTDRPARSAAAVADGSHAGSASVQRPAEIARILPRQERQQRRRAR